MDKILITRIILKISSGIGTYVAVFQFHLIGIKSSIGTYFEIVKSYLIGWIPPKALILFLIEKVKGSVHLAFHLLQSIPPKALVEGLGLVQILWTQGPLYQKLAMLIIGLRIVYYSIRGLMILCIIIHNNLYYAYKWLDTGSVWVMTAPFRFFSWLGKIIESISKFLKDTLKDCK